MTKETIRQPKELSHYIKNIRVGDGLKIKIGRNYKSRYWLNYTSMNCIVRLILDDVMVVSYDTRNQDNVYLISAGSLEDKHIVIESIIDCPIVNGVETVNPPM